MKIKGLLLIAFVLLALVAPVAAQPAHQCGLTLNYSVIYNRIDDSGFAPRAKPGSETIFNCIAARDPNFSNQRFNSVWEALNYWYGLVSQEMGVALQPLPAPTG